MALIAEDHLEQQCLEWFQDIGYSHVFAPDFDNEMRTIAHMPEPVRYSYFSYETPSSVRPGSCPLSVPLVPRFGVNHYGHSESFCAQT
jgi:hypothetical protein